MRRLTILLATMGALLLVPAAHAFAAGTVTVHIQGSVSGEISSVETALEGEPALECSYAPPGPAEGVCENETTIEPEEETFEGIQAIAHSAVGTVVRLQASGGAFRVNECSASGESEFWDTNGPVSAKCGVFAFVGSNPTIVITATFCLEGQPEAECLGEEPAIPNLKLNVEEGEGTVVSNPAGLICTKAAPGSCEAEVAEGKVTLTASPASGYLVKSWKGCDTGGVNGRQCTITATSSLKTVGVKFYKVFSLQGSKTGGLGIMGTAPGGINCGYACSSSTALYKEGGLTVKAKPAKHFHFVEFTGGTGSASSCNGVTSESCTIASFNSNSSIEEVYAEDAKSTLTLSKAGGGQGFVKTKPTNINCGLTCTAAEAEFFASESPEVTVTLGKGTSSVTWVSGAGTCTGNALTCTVPMSESHSLVAIFN